MRRYSIKSAAVLVLVLAALSAWAGGSGEKAAAPEQKPAPAQQAPAQQAPAQQAAKPARLIFSTQGVGTGMYVSASAIIQLVQPKLPAGSTIDMETTGGGISGPILAGTGKADLTLGNVNTTKWLYSGTVLNRPKVPGIRTLVGGFDAPYATIIATDAFVKKTGFKSVGDVIAAKYPVRIAVKTVGMLGEQICRHILECYGSSYDQIKSWGGSVSHVAPADIVSMLRDGRADLTVDHVSEGQAATMELTMTSKVLFWGLPKDIVAKMVEIGYNPQPMKAGSWPSQDYDVETVNAPIVLIANENVPEEIAYLITKTVVENKAKLVEAHASFKPFDPDTAWVPSKLGAPLHPGAARYYKERGFIK